MLDPEICNTKIPGSVNRGLITRLSKTYLATEAPLSRLEPRAEVGLLAYSFSLLFQLPPPEDSPTFPYLASPRLQLYI